MEFAVFQALLDTEFEASAAGQSWPLRLTECVRLARQPGNELEPFSLVFTGPAAPMLEQRTYAMSAAGGETMEIFLVPIGPGPGGLQYQAIFN